MKPAAVKRIRAKLGMTQEALAKELGVTRGAIAQWEAGTARMRASHAKLLLILAERKGAA